MRVINDEQNTVSDFSLKLAFASVGLQEVNQHFGLAQGFAIYEITADGSSMVEVAGFDEQKSYEPGHSEDKLTDKIELVKDCIAVYSNAVGPRAVSRLLECGIHPIKVDVGTPISEIIDSLQQSIQDEDLPGWVLRALASKNKHKEDSTRFDKMFEQEWSEG